MTGTSRLPDWTSLKPSERAGAVRVCLERLGTLGSQLNAVAAMLPSDHAVAGPLAGLPYAAKDLFTTGQHRPSNGLPARDGPDQPRAEVLKRLDAAGASLLAAAEMTALAYEPSGYNSARGRVLNPWDFQAISGGSSSGSAALVASGCVFAALGTDTGGSVRIPAHCCGVTGLKPSYGAIPTDGAMALSPSLDTVGLFARSARDVALLWPVVSGRAVDEPAIRNVRAVALQTFFDDSAPAVSAACQAGVAELSALGINVSSAEGFPEQADNQCLLVMHAQAARTHRSLPDWTDPMLRKRLGKGLEVSDEALAASLDQQVSHRSAFLDGILGSADVALAPVMPIATPDASATDPDAPTFRARTLYALSRFTRFVNYLGLPALAVPVGEDDLGRPVGLQIIGRPQTEPLLLAIGIALQATTTWHARVPTAVADILAAEGGLAA